MALTTTIGQDPRPSSIKSKLITQVTVKGGWIVIHERPETADASPLTDPTAEITDSGNRLVRANQANSLLLRLRYDDGISSVIVSPIIRVFGRYVDPADNADEWMNLQDNGNGSTSALTIDATNDVSDGTDNWTDVDRTTNTFSLQGCNEILVGVQTAFSATGTVAGSQIEGKFI